MKVQYKWLQFGFCVLYRFLLNTKLQKLYQFCRAKGTQNYLFMYLFIHFCCKYEVENASLRVKQTETKAFMKYVFLWRNIRPQLRIDKGNIIIGIYQKYYTGKL